jgi:VanZ family protein
MALIFFLSSLQMPPGAGSVPDWASHGGVYGALAVLICRALAGGLRPISLSLAAVATLLATLYGITDEWHQMYVPHRTAELADVVKDLAGAAAGAALFHALAPRWRVARPIP